MGALGHYLEDEGVATTQFSLVRPHTERIRPPRALWVPFELGRPLGAPDDVGFQRRVLVAVLELFDRESGPVLEDFPEDAPTAPPIEEEEGWACPIPLAPLPAAEEDGLGAALKHEITLLQPWYDLSVEKRGRTTVGASGLEIVAVGDFIAAFLNGGAPECPRDDLTIGETLKLAVEDLRAYYFESAAAQPGRAQASGTDVREWFWKETVASKAFWALRPICAASDDSMMQAMANYILIPRLELGGVGDNPEFTDRNGGV